MASSSPPTVSLPTPPFHDIPGLPNFRDLGGYAAAGYPGKLVRRGVVFRASEPSKLTDDGVRMLQDLKISRVYDLRSLVEIEGSKVVEWDGATRVFAPVFLMEDYSPDALALRFSNFAHNGTAGFVAVYERILETGGQPENQYKPFRAILEHLAAEGDAPPTPLLVHCSAGKDRTGVICALVLSLCGVADDVVAHEYSLTDVGLLHRKEEFVRVLIESPSLKGDRAAAERMVSAKKESMLATLVMLREKYGSVERYVTEQCGLSSEAVERIRKNLLVDIGSDGQGEPLDWESHARLLDL